MQHTTARLVAATALIAALWLAGCAGPRAITSDVRAFRAQTASATELSGARYRFENLPSQTGQPSAARVQAMAQAALAQAGLVRDDSAARLSVLATASINTYWPNTWASPYGWRFGMGYGRWGRGSMFGFGGPLLTGIDDYPVYLSEAGLLMRDLQSGQIVYETHASNDSTWNDPDRVLSALFTAALKNFPNPPPAPFRVEIPLPAASQNAQTDSPPAHAPGAASAAPLPVVTTPKK
ncbi:MAG: DUF4136 domain-containing protein [Burkholderiaceae bacterium]|jgi:hypothetical protein|nr:DUF4136 domain-containing protein [Burkholderiaceae bacterium]